MAKQTVNNIRLGVFVITGLVLLVITLYMIGQNQNFFGSNFTLKARFRNVNGLMPGNNVRFSGIQCGTVKSIEIINDTSIEVTMLIKDETSQYIKENATVSIGNEGLMGNKVVNILPGTSLASQVKDGGMLSVAQGGDLNDMLGTLSTTNDNAADVSIKLKEIADKLNNSPMLWNILNDTSIPGNLRQSLVSIRIASARMEHAAQSVDELVQGVKGGNGVAGVLLSNNEAAQNISATIEHIRNTSESADKLVLQIDSLVKTIHTDVNAGNGIAYSLLKDPELANKLNTTMNNIEKGTAAFNEDMEALKHNFLLRGYFRRQERNKAK